MRYQDINAKAIDTWCQNGWEWGKPISHETYENARQGRWDVLLTPTRPVPHRWFGELSGKAVLGLASGGGQQMPIFAALGAQCTLLDYSPVQCQSDRDVAAREGYPITVVQGDMTQPLPFPDGAFDLIFHPVSNCYVEEVEPIFRECYRVLKPGGRLLGGYDTGVNFLFDDDEREVRYALPFNPLKDPALYQASVDNDWGIQFSHTLEEQLGGQMRAGFTLVDLYEDTNGSGNLHQHGVPAFVAVCAEKARG